MSISSYTLKMNLRGTIGLIRRPDLEIKRQSKLQAFAFGVGLLVALCDFDGNPAHATDIDSSVVITIDSFSFPPILHMSENGEFSGTMGETVKMLCETGGITCEFAIAPLKRVYQNVRSGEVDAMVTINVGQLTECCMPSDWAAPWTAGFFSSQSQRAIPEKPEDLIGEELIVVAGMRSPYLFAENLDQMAEDELLTLYKPRNILSAVRMWLKGRAPLMWGGEDFEWYINKINPMAEYTFEPIIELPVVIWVNKSKPEVLDILNQAFKKLTQQKLLDENNLIIPRLMQQRYQDAPSPQ